MWFTPALGASQCLVRQSEWPGRSLARGGSLAVRLRFTGLAAWWVHRASAVCMLLFVVLVLAAFSLYQRLSYLEWKNWAGSPGVSIATLAFFAALLAHMWVGLRDVLLDYAKPAGLRRLLLGLVAGGLFGSGRTTRCRFAARAVKASAGPTR